MKLFIPSCKSCGQKIPLAIEAGNRSAIRNIYGFRFNVECSNCYSQHRYTPNDVYAESSSNSALSGGAIGAAVGLLGGPLGAIIGGAIGAGIGNEQDNSEELKVKRFNSSR